MKKAIIIGLFCARIALGDADGMGACRGALEACDNLVRAQKTQIEHLQQDVGKLGDALTKAEKDAKKPSKEVAVLLTLSSGLAGAVSPPLIIIGPLLALIIF